MAPAMLGESGAHVPGADSCDLLHAGATTHLKMGGGAVGLGVSLGPVTFRRDTDQPNFTWDLG